MCPTASVRRFSPRGGFFRETKYKMNSWDFRATASYNDVYNDRHILNLYGGMEVNNVDRSSTYFNGVGMQYGMGMLGSYDYKYFKQASEENSMYYSLSNGYSVRLLSSLPLLTLGRAVTPSTSLVVTRVATVWVRPAALAGCRPGTFLVLGTSTRSLGSKSFVPLSLTLRSRLLTL